MIAHTNDFLPDLHNRVPVLHRAETFVLCLWLPNWDEVWRSSVNPFVCLLQPWITNLSSPEHLYCQIYFLYPLNSPPSASHMARHSGSPWRIRSGYASSHSTKCSKMRPSTRISNAQWRLECIWVPWGRDSKDWKSHVFQILFHTVWSSFFLFYSPFSFHSIGSILFLFLVIFVGLLTLLQKQLASPYTFTLSHLITSLFPIRSALTYLLHLYSAYTFAQYESWAPVGDGLESQWNEYH